MVFRYTHTLRVRLDDSLILIKLSRTMSDSVHAKIPAAKRRQPLPVPIVARFVIQKAAIDERQSPLTRTSARHLPSLDSSNIVELWKKMK
jgi:hypothetical protein